MPSLAFQAELCLCGLIMLFWVLLGLLTGDCHLRTLLPQGQLLPDAWKIHIRKWKWEHGCFPSIPLTLWTPQGIYAVCVLRGKGKICFPQRVNSMWGHAVSYFIAFILSLTLQSAQQLRLADLNSNLKLMKASLGKGEGLVLSAKCTVAIWADRGKKMMLYSLSVCLFSGTPTAAVIFSIIHFCKDT